MNPLALPLLLMLSCVLLEAWWLIRAKRQRYSWRDTILNLNSGHLLMWVLRGLEVSVFAWMSAHANLHLLDHWPAWAVIVLCFFAWDFCFYWLHRMHHELPFMWAIHEVHHQGEHFNTSLGIRNSWYSSLASIPFFVGLAVIGIPPAVFIVISSIHYSVQFFNHNGVVGKLGFLERVLITPAHHRVHHGCNPEYTDRNYGGTLQMWDRMFGSFTREIPGVPVVLGVPGKQISFNPFWANNLPLLRWLGWREPLVESADPRPLVSEGYVGLGGVLVFASAIYYVAREGQWAQPQGWIWMLCSFLLTLVLGALSDHKRWALHVWCVTTLVLPPLFMLAFGIADAFSATLLVAMMLHGAAALPSLWKLRR